MSLPATPTPTTAAPIRTSSLVSIRWVVPLLILLPVVLVVAGFSTLAVWQGRRVVDDLTGRIVVQVTARVEERIDAFLTNAVQVTNFTESLIRNGDLDPERLADWQPALTRQLVAFPEISSITFGTDDGRGTWVIRYPDEPGLEYALKDKGGEGEIIEYAIDDLQHIGSQIGRYSYDPRNRPWYRAAVEAGEPTWSPIYSWVRRNGGTSTLGLAYTRPIIGESGDLLGVLDSDMGLIALSRFLESLPIAESGGRVALVGPDGLLLAASGGIPVVGVDEEQIPFDRTSDPILGAVASEILRKLGSPEQVTTSTGLSTRYDGDSYLVEVAPVARDLGLDWRLITIVPESDVNGGLERLRRQTWMIGLLVVGATLALGIAASSALVRPILDLVNAVRFIGRGQFDHQVEVGGTREFARLSDELNRMAVELKDRIRLRQSLGLAMEIQQKLLPDQPPEVPGLDIAGHSTYCDETGGDYYDFLGMERTDSDRLLVVLGDVMGHGIAAALLMATARGILRSRATEPESLGNLLTHVNTLLETDTDGERFMTMIVLLVNARAGEIRWASAGHDPAILYDPEADTFLEMPDINGLPLGLIAGETYHEARRDDLRPGQILLVGTDGIWEACNVDDLQFGKDRLRDVIRQHHHEPAQEIAEAITRTLHTFRGHAHQDDDITFVLLKFVPITDK